MNGLIKFHKEKWRKDEESHRHVLFVKRTLSGPACQVAALRPGKSSQWKSTPTTIERMHCPSLVEWCDGYGMELLEAKAAKALKT